MRQYLAVIGLAVVLSGCEDAANAIHKAQNAANEVVHSVQDTMNLLNLENLSLEQFGSSAAQANTLFLSVQSAINLDFADAAAVAQVEGHIANAYACLVAGSSSFMADELVKRLLSTVSSEDVLGLVQRAVEKGSAEGACVAS